MKIESQLPQEKKLTVVFRVEPGCLGPNGQSHIEEFCRYAHKQLETINSTFIHWEIVPRHDKSLAEMQYSISNKKLTPQQAAKYLERFSKNLEEFEGQFHERLILLIEKYLGNEID